MWRTTTDGVLLLLAMPLTPCSFSALAASHSSLNMCVCVSGFNRVRARLLYVSIECVCNSLLVCIYRLLPFLDKLLAGQPCWLIECD
jgi:hypothetical protein